jgi:phage replication O-like protein O
MSKKGLMPPNYTAIPNELIEMMPIMSGAELRVMLAAFRKTVGYHKVHEFISLTQFEKMTGLSRQGVIDGIEAAIAHGILAERPTRGKRGVKQYAPVYKIDQSTNSTSQKTDQSNELTGDAPTSQTSRPVTSQLSRHTKENGERKLEDKETPPPEKPTLAEVDTAIYTTDAQQVVARYQTRGLTVPLSWHSRITDAIATDGLPAVLDAVDTAFTAGKTSLNYVEGILRNRRNEHALAQQQQAKTDSAAAVIQERIAAEMKTKLVLLGVNDAAA